MKTLLYLHGISGNNRMLLEYAADFCTHYDWKLEVLLSRSYSHSILHPAQDEEDDINEESLANEEVAIDIADQLEERIDPDLLDFTFKKGKLDEVLNQYIHHRGVDMVLLSQHDISRSTKNNQLKDILINTLDTPLLVLPEFQVFQPLDGINFLTTYTENDLDHIISLADLFDQSFITITHFETKMSSPQTKSHNWVKYLENKISGRFEHEILKDDFKSYLQNKNIPTAQRYDAIVFTSRKRKFLERLYDSSTTLNFLTFQNFPSIVFKIS